ncbi:hypothetical protein GOQ27_11550 [Clostridium sp. D2Q-11]|uniref:Uncharacterized protein n=1 Tax=Anaeromonas frigoriresistens TaxID=2683708 RepID=A0A942UZE0_9FIRM|nr:hypothetical protein [Anaeromonas frigoriresistens]MBS4539101.1 hypothetical protein [Anaeromonas frigoriresistens]
MNISKDIVAKEYYKGLLELKETNNEITSRLYEKAIKIDESKFVNEYPLSTLGIVSYRTFWELLLELKIVENPFHCELTPSNEFENKLRNIIESLIYDRNTQYTVNDIVSIFKQYKISA